MLAGSVLPNSAHAAQGILANPIASRVFFTKEASSSTIYIGDTVTYTLQFGLAPDQTQPILVKVTDTNIAPLYMQYNGNSVTGGGTFEPNTQTFTWEKLLVPGSNPIEVTFTATAKDIPAQSLPYQFVNTASMVDLLQPGSLPEATASSTITITRWSNDSSLRLLSLSQGALTPVFYPATLSYTAQVLHSVSSVRVTPTANEAHASIQVRVNAGSWSPVTSGSSSTALDLNVGDNTVEVKVTAQDLSTTTYTITVTRLSNDSSLRLLSLSQGALTPVFNPATLSYTAQVLNSVSSIRVTPTVNEAHASIQVRVNAGSWSPVTSGSSSTALGLNVGNNTVEVKVTAQDLSTTTYTITVTRWSNDSSLRLLSLSQGTLTPVFNPATLSYTAQVLNSVSSIRVTPTANEAHASIQVRVNAGSWSTVTSGSSSTALGLNVGNNTVEVKVTAQDLSSTTYTITVTRSGSASSDSSLSGLEVSAGTLAPAFDPAVLEYSDEVSNSVSSVTVTPTANEAHATIQVRVNGGSWSPVTSGSPSDPLALNVGANTLEIEVTAQDLTTTTYTITVTRLDDSSLSALSLSNSTLTPVFNPAILSYAAQVANSVSSVQVTPNANEAHASIQVRVNGGGWSPVTSGSSSGALNLNVGDNTVEVKVTAQDLSTTTYTVTVTRWGTGSHDSSLLLLALSDGALTPVFDPATLSYAAQVTNDVSSVRVIPTVNESHASIRVRVNGGGWSPVTSGSSSAALDLNVGSNTIDIKVRAQDFSYTFYTVAATRLAPPGSDSLNVLEISKGMLNPAFAPDTLNYTIPLPYSVDSLVFTPTASETHAVLQLRIDGGAWQPLTSGAPSDPVQLIVGNTTLEINVTALDNVTTRTYTLVIGRADASQLSEVKPSVGTLSPPFLPSVTQYTLSVPPDASTITLNLGLGADGAKVEVRVNFGNWITIPNGQPCPPLAVRYGTNLIEIHVTAPPAQVGSLASSSGFTPYDIVARRPAPNQYYIPFLGNSAVAK
jgi:predicted phosphodiesterase